MIHWNVHFFILTQHWKVFKTALFLFKKVNIFLHLFVQYLQQQWLLFSLFEQEKSALNLH